MTALRWDTTSAEDYEAAWLAGDWVRLAAILFTCMEAMLSPDQAVQASGVSSALAIVEWDQKRRAS